MKAAAVSYITRLGGRILVVWNRRYRGWTLPGGLVEEGETLERAQARELLEEAGLLTQKATRIYDAPAPVTGVSVPDRATHVYVFRVEAMGEARERESGCPVSWFTRDEFLASCPFRPFYEQMFEQVPDGHPPAVPTQVKHGMPWLLRRYAADAVLVPDDFVRALLLDAAQRVDELTAALECAKASVR